MTGQPNIDDLINAKRASGYDGAFEALLRQPWYCPHCKDSKTILQVMLPFGDRDNERQPACGDCGKEGIKIVSGDYIRQFRKLLNMLAPFDRSGTA